MTDHCRCRWDKETKKRIPCEDHKREPWKPKRPIYSPLSQDQIYDIGKATEDSLARALFYFAYMTGARISEAVLFKPYHMTKTDNFWRVRMTVLKKRRIDQATRMVPIPRGEKAKCHEDEMMRDVLEFIRDSPPDGHPFLKWGRERLHKPRPGKCMAIYLSRKIQVNVEMKKKGDTGVWFTTEELKPLHPHLLRMCRATHLGDVYGFGDTKIRVFFEWSDSRMAAKYARTADLESSF